MQSGNYMKLHVGQGLDAQESLELVEGMGGALHVQRYFHHSYYLNKEFVNSQNLITLPKERTGHAQMDKQC